ncbi:phage tail protein [Hathewaya massiliensis]|uniref:phage tail protein n=1 Tax=Hathewaya massiliensis TaxID=1964382 RepID=UPI00115BA095|nr:phage tail protein [Hathewaya massiliensis]
MASNVFIENKSLEKVSIKLEKFPKQIPGAAASALNRTLTFTASQTDKEVRNIYDIKSKEVKKTFKKYKASKSNLYAYLESSG